MFCGDFVFVVFEAIDWFKKVLMMFPKCFG